MPLIADRRAGNHLAHFSRRLGEGIAAIINEEIHVVEPVPVPLFSTPVVTILVLAMILAAAVIMKRTAINKA